MRALSAKGFLSISQGAASQISPKNRWHVLDTDFLEVSGGEEFFTHLQEARDLFEPRISALAAERISEEDLVELEEIHRSLKEIGEESATDHADLDIAFHRTIASATNNPVLLSIHDSVSSLGRRQRQAATNVEGAIGRAIFWHEQILQSLQERDSAGAEAAMGLHMSQVREELRGLGMDIQADKKEKK
jgi:DNA-binding FadR family transcriptional regulator